MDVIVEINSNRSGISECANKLLRNQCLSRWKAIKAGRSSSFVRPKSKLNTSTSNIETISDLPSITKFEMNYFESVDEGSLFSSKTLTSTENNKNRVMTAKKCSDVYREVIGSLINDNLLTYSKYYEEYLEPHPTSEVISNSDEMDSFRYTNTISSKTRPFSRNNSVANMRSALRTAKKRVSTGNKQATFSDSIDTYNKSRLNIVTPDLFNSSFSMPPRRAVSAVAAVRPRKAEKKFRLTDLIFAGYEKPPKIDSENMLDENVIEEEHDFIVHRNFKEFKEVSPSYKIKVYDREDKKELEMAKQDLYERYGRYNLKKKALKEAKALKSRSSLHVGPFMQQV